MEKEEIELTLKERLLLYNQFLILQELHPKEKEMYKRNCTILECGYHYHYDELTDFFTSEFRDEKALFARDVLYLYRCIIYSYRNLIKNGNDISITEDDIRFPGFDGNDDYEAGMIGYVQFILSEKGIYEEITNLSRGEYNSHRQMRDEYISKLKALEQIPERDQFYMSEDEIKMILQTY